MREDLSKYERCKDLPYIEMIRENQPVVIPSIFMFESSVELHSFLYACEQYNCTVFFTNEKLMISPNHDTAERLHLLCYEVIIDCREVGDAYVRYLGEQSKMTWSKGEHEPILK